MIFVALASGMCSSVTLAVAGAVAMGLGTAACSVAGGAAVATVTGASCVFWSSILGF